MASAASSSASSVASKARAFIEEAVATSLRRMDVERLDLLQFHWWDYGDRRYLDALRHLADLRAEGRIRHLGLTNFDTERLAIIADHGIPIVSNQVQYSLVDRRPDARMAAWCHEHGVSLLAYGTILGGLLSEKYLGRAEPGRADLNTASLRKYKQMIDAWGGWALFQELLPSSNGWPTNTGSASPPSRSAISSTARRWPGSSSAPGLG